MCWWSSWCLTFPEPRPSRSAPPDAAAASAILRQLHIPHRTPARLRIPSYAVWETVVFVLNVLAFDGPLPRGHPLRSRINASGPSQALE